MTQVHEETETKGGVWMPVEDYAALLEKDTVKRGALLRRVKSMLHPNCPRTPVTFDSRHVKRISNRLVYLYVSKPTATAEAAPRIVPRKK
jgi:hypothetical protein